MFRFRELLEAHRAELAATITNEHGKVLADADGEITRGIEVVEFACGAPRPGLAGEAGWAPLRAGANTRWKSSQTVCMEPEKK